MRYAFILLVVLCSTPAFETLQAQSAATVSLSGGLILRSMSSAGTGGLIELSANERSTKRLLYSLAVGYHQWEAVSNVTAEKLVDIPIHGGVRWEIFDGEITPYSSIEAGLHILQRVVNWTSLVIPPPSWALTFDRQPRERRENIGRIGIRLGVGVAFDLLQSLQLDFGARFVYVPDAFVELGGQPETATAIRHADAVIGIRYHF